MNIIEEKDENLDRIRDILLGPCMREYEERLARLEGHFSAVSTELREDMRKRLDALETYVQQRVGVLIDQMKAHSRQKTFDSDSTHGAPSRRT